MGSSLHHVQLFYPAGEEARARAFYGAKRRRALDSARGHPGQLGLRELDRPSSFLDRPGLWFEAGAGQVHLSVDDDLALHPRRHFALRTENLDALRARLRMAGARFEEATPIPGWRRVFVFDPFGNKIELDEIP